VPDSAVVNASPLIDGSELQLIERFRDVANALAVESGSALWCKYSRIPAQRASIRATPLSCRGEI
jgi:hypothetical protein